jgi:hypothetical protein
MTPAENPFFERPILNSPYDYPRKHWELDDSGQPTQRVSSKLVAIQTLYLFVRLRCKPNRVYPFFPLVVSSRMTLLTQSGASVECHPDSFLLLGFGGGGFGSFSYTGINLELLKKSKLKLSGRSM